MARLTKQMKRGGSKPVIEVGTLSGHTSGYGEYPEREFIVVCMSPWRQGVGNEHEYTVHLTKREMLFLVKEWMAALETFEREAEQAATKALVRPQ